MSSSGGDKLRKDKRSVSLEKRERNHEKKTKKDKDSKGDTVKHAEEDNDERKSSKRS